MLNGAYLQQWKLTFGTDTPLTETTKDNQCIQAS